MFSSKNCLFVSLFMLCMPLTHAQTFYNSSPIDVRVHIVNAHGESAYVFELQPMQKMEFDLSNLAEYAIQIDPAELQAREANEEQAEVRGGGCGCCVKPKCCYVKRHFICCFCDKHIDDRVCCCKKPKPKRCFCKKICCWCVSCSRGGGREDADSDYRAVHADDQEAQEAHECAADVHEQELFVIKQVASGFTIEIVR